MTDAEQALAIATLSLIVGGGSLSWNIFTWVRQRAKMRLTLTWGHMDPDGEIIVDTTSHDLADAVALDDRYGGAGMPMVVVKIRNGGRGPMSVQDAGFEFPAGYTYRDGAVNDHEKIPGLLDREHFRYVYAPVDHLYEIWSQNEDDPREVKVRGFAWLGNGKHVRSKALRLRWSDRALLTERSAPQ